MCVRAKGCVIGHICVCVCVCVCDQKTFVYTLTGRMSSRKGCILLTHLLYNMSPEMFARSIESYRECYSPHLSFYIQVIVLRGNFWKLAAKSLPKIRDCHTHCLLKKHNKSQFQCDGSVLKLQYRTLCTVQFTDSAVLSAHRVCVLWNSCYVIQLCYTLIAMLMMIN